MAQLMSIKRNVEMCPGQVSVPAIYHVSQGDKGTRIILGLVNNSANYTIPEGTTATIRGHRADGTLFTEITADVETTEVKFNLTEDMSAVPGRAECEAVLVSGSANVIGTANFIVDIERSPASIGSVIPGTDAATAWLIDKLENEPINALNDESVVDAISNGSGSGLTEDIKTALLACFEKVAWIDEDGQDYYDALYNALYTSIPATGIALSSNSLSFAAIGVSQTLTATLTPSDSTSTVVWSSSDTSVATVTQGGVVTSVAVGSATITATAGNASATCSILVSQATLSSISAVYTQSGTVYDTYSLDSLKSDLVVTATWSDSSTSIIASTDYTLTGTLTVGTSTVTVSYGGKTDTFTVTVSSSNNYIAVGNPVIVDGILSPTEGNFIKTPDVFSPGNNPWKIITKYKFNAVPGASKFQDVMGSVDSSNTSVRGILMECAGNANASSAKMQAFISSNTSSWDIVGNLTLYKEGLDTNWLWYEVSFDGVETYAIRWSTDGENWTASSIHCTKTSSSKIVDGYAIGFGIKRDTTLNGEIDLNECRIYINDQLWWQPIAS